MPTPLGAGGIGTVAGVVGTCGGPYMSVTSGGSLEIGAEKHQIMLYLLQQQQQQHQMQLLQFQQQWQRKQQELQIQITQLAKANGTASGSTSSVSGGINGLDNPLLPIGATYSMPLRAGAGSIGHNIPVFGSNNGPILQYPAAGQVPAPAQAPAPAPAQQAPGQVPAPAPAPAQQAPSQAPFQAPAQAPAEAHSTPGALNNTAGSENLMGNNNNRSSVGANGSYDHSQTNNLYNYGTSVTSCEFLPFAGVAGVAGNAGNAGNAAAAAATNDHSSSQLLPFAGYNSASASFSSSGIGSSFVLPLPTGLTKMATSASVPGLVAASSVLSSDRSSYQPGATDPAVETGRERIQVVGTSGASGMDVSVPAPAPALSSGASADCLPAPVAGIASAPQMIARNVPLPSLRQQSAETEENGEGAGQEGDAEEDEEEEDDDEEEEEEEDEGEEDVEGEDRSDTGGDERGGGGSLGDTAIPATQNSFPASHSSSSASAKSALRMKPVQGAAAQKKVQTAAANAVKSLQPPNFLVNATDEKATAIRLAMQYFFDLNENNYELSVTTLSEKFHVTLMRLKSVMKQ
jgi:hypothetical protein